MSRIIQQPAEGLLLIEPKVIGDHRGYFFESYSEAKFADLGIKCKFVQDNQSLSRRGIVRGLHFQRSPKSQAKLVRVTLGEVLDVVVDIRPGSKTFGKSFTFHLSDKNQHMLFVPKGFAHGYSTLSETAIFVYKCDEYYAPDCEGGIMYNDPDLAINWQVPSHEIVLSDRDKKWPNLKELKL
jgi:dTDP-4-dehydrorhamnose 3,5-epimerase